MRHMKIYIPLFLILILFTSMPIVLGDLEEDSPIIVDGFAGVSKDTSNAEIYIQGSGGGTVCRGFVSWNVSALPYEPVRAISISFEITSSNAPSGVIIKNMTVNPVTADNTAIKADIASGTMLGSFALGVDTYHEVFLSDTAVESLQAILNSSREWWALGFMLANETETIVKIASEENGSPEPVLTLKVEMGDYYYTLHGLYYENGPFLGEVNITAVTSSGPEEYMVNGSRVIAKSEPVAFFFWNLPGGGIRRIYTTYNIETFYLFTPHDTYSSYAFDITDYIGAIGFQDSYLELYSTVNSTTYLVERYLIWDSESESPLTAMLNKIYSLKISLPDDKDYSFGYWVPTTATPPTLTLSLLDPDDYYQPISGIVEIEATRPNATHIQVVYLDKMGLTLSVFVNITLRNETMVYNVTGGSSFEIFDWYDAVNTTEYTVNVEVSHTYYGEITYSTTLIGEMDYDDPPSWEILGIQDEWIWTGLIVVVAGTVSMIHAAAGLFAGASLASAFVYLEFVEIPYELIAGAFIISILMGMTKK